MRALLSSPKFVDGFAGEGWRIWLAIAGAGEVLVTLKAHPLSDAEPDSVLLYPYMVGRGLENRDVEGMLLVEGIDSSQHSLPFDPTDYMIGGKVIRVSFQEGSELAGQGDEDNGTFYFEVTLLKALTAVSSSSSARE